MLIDKIKEFAEKENMLSPGDTVVCGLSGGADSVCLLLALCGLSKAFDLKVEALHVNHCLRGAESDRDENFCRELCKRLDIDFNAVSCDVRGYAEEHALSTEEAARKLRYGIFAEHSQGKKLATAHNANDNLETVILNLTRGTGLKGLAGIPPVRDNIIRPLLTVTRQEIEDYLTQNGQDHVTDSTNLSDDYTRNRIRHNIISVMTELNPSVAATSVRSISALRDENRFIELQTDDAEKACRSGNTFNGLASYSDVIRKRCISRMLTDNSIPYSFERLETLDRIVVSKGKQNISGNLYFTSNGNESGIVKITENADIPALSAELVNGINQIFSDRVLVSEVIECDKLKKFEAVHNLVTYYVLDYDKIVGRALVRNRRFGDKIRLSGRSFTSSVKKLINEKVPAEYRSRLHFIEDEEGTIFAEMLGIADRVKPGVDSKKLLVIYIRDHN